MISLRGSSVAQTRQQEEVRFGEALKAVVDRNAYPDVSGPLAILSEFSSDTARRRGCIPVLVQQLLSFHLVAPMTCFNCSTRDSIDVDLSALTGAVITEGSMSSGGRHSEREFAIARSIVEWRQLVVARDSTYTRLDTTRLAMIRSVHGPKVDQQLTTGGFQQKNGAFQFWIQVDSMTLSDFHDNKELVQSARLIPNRLTTTNSVKPSGRQ
ncbi:MAG TPA: hypothetical protein VGM50_22375 [Gemmatimonadaceae bacterium]